MAHVAVVKSFADVKVQIVSSESGADLLVFNTSSASEAKGKDEIWFMAKSFPDLKVSYVTSFPDLKVCFVNSKNRAGWKNLNHKLQGQLG